MVCEAELRKTGTLTGSLKFQVMYHLLTKMLNADAVKGNCRKSKNIPKVILLAAKGWVAGRRQSCSYHQVFEGRNVNTRPFQKIEQIDGSSRPFLNTTVGT